MARHILFLVVSALSLAACSNSKPTNTHDNASCGTCPTGYSCGTANGTPVCFSPTGIPTFSNVVVIMMENTSLSTLQAAGNTPYLTALGPQWATSSNYHGVTHPSLRNYISLTSGDVQGIGCDCHPTGSSCNAFNCERLVGLGSCGCAVSANNIADELEAAGLTWHDYGENMDTPCNTTDHTDTLSNGQAVDYVARHNPFLYYDSILNSARCAANVVDYSNFAPALSSGLPNFSLIAPNLTDDMHNPFPATSQNYANGDAWLSTQVPQILASAPWQAGGAGLLLIVWDEDDLSGGLLQDTDDPIPFFLISPLAQKNGYVSPTRYDHYSLLATIEDAFDVPRIDNAATATPLVDFFPNGGAPSGGTTGTSSSGGSTSGGGCSQDADCNQGSAGTGLVCVNGACAQGCNQASDCPADESCDQSTSPGTCEAQCVSGQCACASDEQCSNGLSAAEVICGDGGLCLAGCREAGDCGPNQGCDEPSNSCVTCAADGSCLCAQDSQCNGGQMGTQLVCGGSGECVMGCNSPSDCPATSACDTSSGSPGTCDTCTGAMCGCSTDSQCNGGQTGQGVVCGQSGNCVAGCDQNSDCPSGNCSLATSPGTCQ